ncbi:MAG: glycosyltransferase [Clostridia bacterium]|nr:glycosyltransferase [Clostridia bacterium]
MEKERAKAKVSVIVPVYNTAAFLPACAESLSGQTHADLELIFVDDGSTDGSGALLDAYAADDSRIRVIHQRNGGVSAARNAGIEAATGAYIGFVDSDDFVEPVYCEALLSAFSEHPEIGVSICNRFIHGHPNGRETGGAAGAGRVLAPDEAIRYMVSIGKSFEGYLWNKLFKAELFHEMQNGKPRFRLDESLAICEDLLLCTEIFASGQSAYYNGTPLYHYNYRESGALRTLDDKRMTEFEARARIELIAGGCGTDVLHAAELSHVKAALNLLAAAKEQKNGPLAAAMKRRIDARMKGLLKAKDLKKSERGKLLIRRAFPVLSLRIFNRFGAK